MDKRLRHNLVLVAAALVAAYGLVHVGSLATRATRAPAQPQLTRNKQEDDNKLKLEIEQLRQQVDVLMAAKNDEEAIHNKEQQVPKTTADSTPKLRQDVDKLSVAKENTTTTPNRSPNKVLFFHVGKGGGGTVEEEMKEYKLPFQYCHPDPSECLKHLSGTEQVLVNVRDPVDRFVSAFHWRALMLCGKEDPRKNSKRGGDHYKYPQSFCQSNPNYHKERDILHEQYHYNVNELAEALCDDGPKRDLARQHVNAVRHMKYSLSDWLNNIQPSSKWLQLQRVVAAVMEPPLDFKATTHHALEYLVQRELVKASHSNSTSATQLHSSKSFPDLIPKFKTTEVAQCCLARHLAKDYELLKVMAGSTQNTNADPRLAQACQWGTQEDSKKCQASLQSMIERREPFLKDLSLSCPQVVSKEQAIEEVH